MKPYLLAACLFLPLHNVAQTPDSRGIYAGDMLEDVDLGWMNQVVIKTPAKPFTQYGWSYTSAQTDAAQKIGSWIQQTYTQRGLLGEIRLSLLAPEPSYPITSREYDYNEAEKNNRNALPNTYGALAKFHKCISRTSTKKYWPTPGNHCYVQLNIMANNVQLISKQVVGLSSTDEYYCFMPKYEPGMKGRYDQERLPATLAYRNFNSSPHLKNYQHYVLPAKTIDLNADAYVIIMTPDNKPLPFEQVTVRELISRLEAQFPMIHKIASNEGLTTRMPLVLEEAKKGLQIFKNKFKDRLNEYVYSADMNRNIDLLTLSQITENSEINWIATAAETTSKNGWKETGFPLLRLKKGVKQTLATGAPQWIIFKIDSPIGAAYGGSIQTMDNFVSHFNYDYVYRYFFGKDKVIEPYKPLGSVNTPAQAIATAPEALSPGAKAKAADRSVVFFEDFSTTPVDAPPLNWTTQRSEISGNPVTVTTVDNEKGKWLKLKRNASPKNFPQDLSGDFELSYDLLVHKGDVPWGTPGIDVELKIAASSGDKNITLNVSPGDMNRADAAGWVMINGLPACKVSNYYSLPLFTGSKPVNKATITVQRKGDSVTIKCNGNKVYECSTAFATASTLKGLKFYVNEKNLFYLSNIEIRKI